VNADARGAILQLKLAFFDKNVANPIERLKPDRGSTAF